MTNISGKKALVTGGTGFIGSHLASRLCELGWDTHVVIRNTSEIKLIEPFMDNLNIHVLEENLINLNTIISNIKPDCTFHIASLFLSRHERTDIPRLVESNILFGSILIEALVVNNCYNLINTSTSWEHFQGQDYNPVNLYAATKKAFNDIARYYVEARKLKMITLKLFDTYGPNDPRPKLMELLLKATNSGETIHLSPGYQKLNFVHVDDVTQAYILAAHRIMRATNQVNEEYFVKGKEEFDLRELVELIEKILGKTIHVEWGKRPYRDREVMFPANNLDILPGWTAQIVLENGLRQLLS